MLTNFAAGSKSTPDRSRQNALQAQNHHHAGYAGADEADHEGRGHASRRPLLRCTTPTIPPPRLTPTPVSHSAGPLPVYHNERRGFWALSRCGDVFSALKDVATFPSGTGISLERDEHMPRRCRRWTRPATRSFGHWSAAHSTLGASVTPNRGCASSPARSSSSWQTQAEPS